MARIGGNGEVGALELESLGEGEEEREATPEAEDEGEQLGEEFLGTLGSIAGRVLGGLGEGELEFEDEGEGEEELELESELEEESEGEAFFGRFRRLARRWLPSLRSIARVAVPAVAGAVAGPLGARLGRVATSLLEAEFEDELEMELEGEEETETELEGELEAEALPATQHEAMAELLASVASSAQSELEAEAMVGAAAVSTLSAADRAAIRSVLPHLVRGAAVLTRLLRRRRATRQAVRLVPTVVRRTATTLARRSNAGRPVTRATAARVMAAQTRRVLTSPHVCAVALRRNVTGTRAATRLVRRPPARRPNRPIRG